jgi:hypothetical protein
MKEYTTREDFRTFVISSLHIGFHTTINKLFCSILLVSLRVGLIIISLYNVFLYRTPWNIGMTLILFENVLSCTSRRKSLHPVPILPSRISLKPVPTSWSSYIARYFGFY